ncbi:hypothetical protein Asp14428_77130 [Actinoplanes sp. NBRC 14428]|nr:hypothetical protein Asp14428_77130 [Actinoplanes sp. NBRC 14428]
MDAGAGRLVAFAAAPFAAALVAAVLLDRFPWWLTGTLALCTVGTSGLGTWVPRPRLRGERGRLPPSNLPPPPTNLIGRSAYATSLAAHLTAADGRSRRLAVVAGEPGIGKTAFALHVAHDVAREFPGGELFFRFDPADKRIVRHVRQRIIAALSTGDALPFWPWQQRSQYRRLFSRLGRDNELLIVFDDVRRARHLRALLPASPWCAVVVTTRTELGGLPATREFVLHQLELPAAVEMLGAIIGPGRVRAEPAFAQRIVAAARCRPLAVQLVGMALANRPNIRLAVAHDRMRAGTGGHPPTGDTALDLSHAMLTKKEQRALMAVGLFGRPGHRFAPWELAALMAGDLRSARETEESQEREAWRLCDRLTDAGLLERHSPDAVGVQLFRPLERVELYAQQLAGRTLTEQERSARRTALQVRRSRRRQPAAHAGGEIFEQLNRTFEQGRISRAFKDARDQVSLARDKNAGAAEAEATTMLAELHAELGGLEEHDDLVVDPLASGFPPARLRALRIRARIRRRRRDLEGAGADLEAARRLNVDLSDPVEEVRRLQEAAIVAALGPEPQRGLQLLDGAAELSNEHQDQWAGIAYARSWVLVNLDRPGDAQREAADGERQARRTGQRLWAVWLTYQQGYCRAEARADDEVNLLAGRALEEFGEMRHRYGAAHCRLLLGRVALARDEHRRAGALLGEALAGFRYCDDTWIEAVTAEYLARALDGAGRSDAAAELLQDAHDLFAAIGADDRARVVRASLRSREKR